MLEYKNKICKLPREPEQSCSGCSGPVAPRLSHSLFLQEQGWRPLAREQLQEQQHGEGSRSHLMTIVHAVKMLEVLSLPGRGARLGKSTAGYLKKPVYSWQMHQPFPSVDVVHTIASTVDFCLRAPSSVGQKQP